MRAWIKTKGNFRWVQYCLFFNYVRHTVLSITSVSYPLFWTDTICEMTSKLVKNKSRRKKAVITFTEK